MYTDAEEKSVVKCGAQMTLRIHYTSLTLVLTFSEVRFETGMWKSLQQLHLDFEPETICTSSVEQHLTH
jgi:hypothetical protein